VVKGPAFEKADNLRNAKYKITQRKIATDNKRFIFIADVQIEKRKSRQKALIITINYFDNITYQMHVYLFEN
jgi:hypothetical protein